MKCNEKNLRLYVNSIFPTLNFRLMRPYVVSCLAFYIYKEEKEKITCDKIYFEKTKLALAKNYFNVVSNTFESHINAYYSNHEISFGNLKMRENS